jgi:hypothetical protein
MARKKKRTLGPRQKRIPRQRRLDSTRATGWVEKFKGKDFVRSYGKWFGVDALCAIIELRMLGVSISQERENQIRASDAARANQRRRRKAKAAAAMLEESPWDSDDHFAYIAGYTSGGLPFGVTWKEAREIGLTGDE